MNKTAFQRPSYYWLAAVLLGTALLASCSAFGGAQNTPAGEQLAPVTEGSSGIIAEGRIVPRDDANLFFSTGGEVIEILVKEGDAVNRGSVLARLGDRETFEANITSAQLELANAQRQWDDLNEKASLVYQQAVLEVLAAEKALTDASEKLDKIDTEDYQSKVDDANATVADAKTELEDAQDEFDKYKDLDKDQPNRQRSEDALTAAQDKYDEAVRARDRLVNDLEQARSAVDLAKAQLEDAQRTRDAHQAGPDPKDLALTQARLDNANAQLNAAQAALRKLDLVAPFDGSIATIDISVGERVQPNQMVMVIGDFSAWYVETTDLTENDVVSITVGDSVMVVPDALPEQNISGTIERIGDTYIEKSGDINYTVRILLGTVDAPLRWGMTVEVRFQETRQP